MGYPWSAGDRLDAADLNSAIRVGYSRDLFITGVSANQGTAVMAPNGEKIFIRSGANAVTPLYCGIYLSSMYYALAAITGLTPDPDIMTATDNYIYACGVGTGTVYRYDNDFANEQAMSWSGTQPDTGIFRMWADVTGNIYIQETSAGDATIKKYSVSGTTLTYVSTFELSEVPEGNYGAAGNDSYFVLVSLADTTPILKIYDYTGTLQFSVTANATSSTTLRGIFRNTQSDMIQPLLRFNSDNFWLVNTLLLS